MSVLRYEVKCLSDQERSRTTVPDYITYNATLYFDVSKVIVHAKTSIM